MSIVRESGIRKTVDESALVLAAADVKHQVRRGGEGERQVEIRWFDLGDEPDADPAECWWLIGEIEPPLDPGVWDFHAPSFGGEILDTPTLTLRMHAPDDAGSPSPDARHR